MSAEREVKLSVPAGFVLPDLADVHGVVPGPAETLRYATVYVDTEDLRLARWGVSLRHREREGWTLKLPSTGVGAMVVRDEIVFEGDPRTVPPRGADLVQAYTRDAVLRPVVRMRTLRRRTELRDAEGQHIGEMVDDEVSVMEGPRVAARFREVEVEATDALPEATLEAILERLRDAGASPTDGAPKYRQALGARSSSPPEIVEPELDDEASVAEVVRGAVAAAALRLMRHDAGVRLGEDIEDVHQARVATRRLRSDLRTFRDVLDPEWDAALREELGWLGGELGTVRDLDVQLDRLRGRVELLPQEDRAVGEQLVADLERRREEARVHLLAAMRSGRYPALIERLIAAAREPAVLPDAGPAPASLALGAVMERPWKHLKGSLDGLGDDAPDADLHMARIRTKRARYAAEAVAPVFGKRARAFAKAAAELQEVLGEHQDAVVAQAWLREAVVGEAAGGETRKAFVAGELAAVERAAASEARTRWRGAWKALSRKRLRFWP